MKITSVTKNVKIILLSLGYIVWRNRVWCLASWMIFFLSTFWIRLLFNICRWKKEKNFIRFNTEIKSTHKTKWKIYSIFPIMKLNDSKIREICTNTINNREMLLFQFPLSFISLACVPVFYFFFIFPFTIINY